MQIGILLLAGLLMPVSVPRALGNGNAAEGYRLLTEKAFLPPDFDQDVFDQLWQVWPAALRDQAASAPVEERRRMAFRRYGLSPRPEGPPDQPLQYVVDAQGRWSMNCFACHGGELNGTTVPGLPNRNYLLETLTADVRKVKLRTGKSLGHMDVGSLLMPLGSTRGTTNAVMFGVALLAFRDRDLNVLRTRIPPRMTHHDMDAPAWWHFRRKEHIYIDGFAVKAPRPLMQFLLVEQNGPQQFHQWEADFEHIYAYLNSLRPPPSPLKVDRDLAKTGSEIFDRICAECHGNPRSGNEYPERLVPWDELRTDPVRLQALTVDHRNRYAASWFAEDTQDGVDVDPGGYVAPPLDGIWATAPYLHNGSVPTLWHLLHPDHRPVVWRRQGRNYDFQRVGVTVDEFDALPPEGGDPDIRHEFFDTRAFGKSAQGHTYPEQLSEDEKLAVLEFLKTL